MKMRFSLGLFILMLGCSSPYKYWDISKFNMAPNALADDEEIKLIYSSRSPGNNKDLDYYIQLVVVSQKTGDTVNVLTTEDNGLTSEDGNKVFNYFGPDNIVTKISSNDLDKLRDSKDVDKDIDKINKTELKKIDKVVRDPQYDQIADNKFPTVIGSIGTLTQNETK